MSKLLMEIVFVVCATMLADAPDVRPVKANDAVLAKLKSGPLVVPAEVQGEPGEFVVISAETSGKKVVFYAIDPGLKRFPPELLNTTKSAVYTAGKSGKYRVLVYTAVGDEPTEPLVCVVTIGKPGPDPEPEPDLSPLAKRFKELLQMEQQSDKYVKAKLLISCIETAAEMANNSQYKNAGELESAVRTATVAKIGQGHLPLIGKEIGEVVTRVVGDDPAKPLTVELRGMLNSIYSKSAEALRAAIGGQ